MNKVRDIKMKKVRTALIILVVLIGLGYAALRSGLNINGITHVQNATWDVHFENYQRTSNSTVTPSTAPDTTGNNKTTVTYEVTLNNPGDIYEFTLDVVNSGTMDVMIESFSSKLNNTEITSSNLPGYLEYSVAYDDGVALANKQALAHNTQEKVKLRVKYRDDISTSVLPQTTQDLVFNFEIIYVQDDGTSVPVRVTDANFATDSWDNIIAASKVANPTQLQADMATGTTRAVPLDLNLDGTSDATCNLRIANLSTPAACATEGFSQTACGLVLECANVIDTRTMNTTNTNAGGWPASAMRTYLNDETANAVSIYNALPSELSSKIIPTYVVSGHGYQSGATNYTSTDKLYLLSTKEVGFDVNYDSAKAETRILDFYNLYNNDQTRVKKNSSNSATNWWLRAAHSTSTYSFTAVNGGGSDNYNGAYITDGVSPAFRIG